MGLELILNAAWLLSGVIAVSAVLSRAHQSRGVLLRSIGLGLIVAALFPIISASDDVIRLQYLERVHAREHHHEQQKPNSGEPKHSSDTLIRLYEALETPISSGAIRICFIAFFTFIFITAAGVYSRSITVMSDGRAPPVACIA